MLSTTPTVNFCACYQRREVGCLHTTSSTTATMGFRHPPFPSHFSQSLSLLFSSRDSYVIRVLPKLNQNFPFLKVWSPPITIGLHSADPFCDPISYSSLFWLVVSPTSTLLSLFLSLVRKNNFICFGIFSASQKLTISLASFSLWEYIV